MHELIQSKSRNHQIFLLVGLLGIVVTTLYALISGKGNIWNLFIYEGGKDHFMDFFNHIQYCREPDKVYFVSMFACFPALPYVFYSLLGRLLPVDQITNFDASKTEGYAYLVYVLYTVLLVIVLCNLISVVLKDFGRKYILLFEIQVVLSYSFVSGNFERGNASFLCLNLLLAAVMLRDSDNRVKREMALILIAVAAGFKIYPAIFGLLYILEKRYRETVRLLIYGIVAFFVPFIWFGGVAGFMQFVRNLADVEALGGNWVIKTQIQRCVEIFGVSAPYLGIFIGIIYIGLLGCIILAICKTKKLYLRLILLVSIMVLFPARSGMYTISYFLIPLLIYLRDEERISILDSGIEFAFGLIFTLIAIKSNVFKDISLSISVFGCYFVALLALIQSLLSEDGKRRTGGYHETNYTNTLLQ